MSAKHSGRPVIISGVSHALHRRSYRHALSFEIIGLALVVPLGALVFGMPHESDIGIVGCCQRNRRVRLGIISTIWVSIIFLQRLRGTTLKTTPIRVVHAALFELGLLIVLMPLSPGTSASALSTR